MKVKKMGAILMVAVLSAVMMAGCGGNSDSGVDSNQTDAAKESEGSVSEAESMGSTADVENVTLTMTTTFQETEYAGEVITHFKDYLEEKSGGNMTLDVYWGGTLAGNSEELSFVSSGTADMSLLNNNNYTDVFPLLAFPSHVYGDNGFQASLDIFKYMMEENTETAELIKEQVEAQNVHMLGGMPVGTNSFATKKECDTLEDLTKLKLGAGVNLSAFSEMGFNVVSIMPSEYYDSLSRGIVECGNMPLGVLVSLQIQEVAPYFALDGSYNAGNFFTINLDKWNSLSADAQNLLNEAMTDTQEFAVNLAQEQTESAVDTVEAAGGKVVTLPEEDQKTIQNALFKTAVSDARSYAKTAGCEADMETVLNAVSEYLGIVIQ